VALQRAAVVVLVLELALEQQPSQSGNSFTGEWWRMHHYDEYPWGIIQ